MIPTEQLLTAIHEALRLREFGTAAVLICALDGQAPEMAGQIRAAIGGKA